MTRKQGGTLCAVIGLVVGIICGIATTAFAMGAERQKITDALVAVNLKVDSNKALYTEFITIQVKQVQDTLSGLSSDINNLRVDVHVLKAITERIEQNMQSTQNSN